jgi:hypothetical protein
MPAILPLRDGYAAEASMPCVVLPDAQAQRSLKRSAGRWWQISRKLGFTA